MQIVCLNYSRGCPTAAMRRVAHDTAAPFAELHARLSQRGPAAQPAAALEALQYAETVGDVLESADSARERAIWDLLDLFFAKTANAAEPTVGSHAIAAWCRRNIAALPGGHPLPPELLDTLSQASLPEAQPVYWHAVLSLAALGWMAECIVLLGMHSAWLDWEPGSGGGGGLPGAEAQVGALEAVTLLLRRFPTPEADGRRTFASDADFAAHRRAWKEQCSALLRDEALWDDVGAASGDTSSGLRRLLRLLSGDAAVAASAAAFGDGGTTWPRLLAARLLHASTPSPGRPELRRLLADCLVNAPPPAPDAFEADLAAVFDACCDLDAQGAVRACSAACSDWFMAHSLDLVSAHPAAAQVLGRELSHLGGRQAEFYALEYAAALAPHAATWQVATTYLAWCPTHGAGATHALARTLPLSAGDDVTALRLVQLLDGCSLDAQGGLLRIK
jgi:hypothetical protein